jgi:hypothetical protein
METVYKKREGNLELRIYPDYDAESPRQWDNVETLDNYHVYGAYYFDLVEFTTCDCCQHESEESIESCGGFYGPITGEGGAKESIKEHLDTTVQPLIEDWY